MSTQRLQVPYGPAGRDHFRRRDDALRIDAEMAVEVLHGSGLAEMLDAERAGAMARTAPSQASVAGWPSMTVTSPQCGRHAPSSRSTWLRAWTRPRSRARCAAVQPALSRSAEVMASSPTSRRSSPISPTASIASGATAPVIGDDHLRRSGRARAANRRRRRCRMAKPGVICALRLLERARREAQIDRAAGLVAQPGPLVRLAFAVALHVVERPSA